MKTNNWYRPSFLVLLMAVFFWPVAEAATQVTSITANPDPFNPIDAEVTAFTVAATPGVTQLEIRILSSDLTQLVRTGLALTESVSGEYTASWDGRTNNNQVVTAGSYAVRVFNNATTTYLGPVSTVTVEGLSFSPNPFTPTGTNAVTFTVQANPGQSGMSLDIRGTRDFWSKCSDSTRLPLSETATAGVYTAEWTAVGLWDGYYCRSETQIALNLNYTVYVYDSAGNQSATTGQLTVSGVSAVSAAPTQFNPSSSETTTITASGVAGLQLEARFYQGATLMKTVPMAANAETYTATWDGRDTAGNIAALGSYSVQIWHVGSPARYARTTTVQISSGVASITPSPNPFTPTGTNAVTFTVQANPGQSGMSLDIRGTRDFWSKCSDSTRLPLSETATAGVYTAEWTAVGLWDGYYCRSETQIALNLDYTVYVYDSAGNQSATTGQLTVSGVSAVSAAPTQFNPSSSETTTITASGVAGLQLEARFYQGATLMKTVPMAANAETYTATWDGRDTAGNIAALGSYSVQIWHVGSPARYARTTTVQISSGVASITPSPNPFTPTGTNAVTFTVQANPGQSGMSVDIRGTRDFWSKCSDSTRLPLSETATAGVYTAEWTAVGLWDGYYCRSETQIALNLDYTVYVYDSAGNQSATTGQLTVSGVSAVSAAPTQFNPSSSETTTITASGVAGLQLEARFYQGATLMKTVPMAANAETYTATWDGRDTAGNIAALGSYSVQIWHVGSPARYARTTTVQISSGVASITPSPNPFTPTGTNAVTFTVQANPGQSGMSVDIRGTRDFWSKCSDSTRLPLSETATAGVYTAEWTAVGLWDGYYCRSETQIALNLDYTVYVYDSAGNQSATTGQLTISGVSAVSAVPSPFTPGGNNVATITANAAPGLNLEARLVNNTTSALTRTLPMTEASGTYTGEWDGKDSFGNFAGANTYRIEIYHTGSDARYSRTSNVVVNVAVFAISASPDPFVPTGDNTATITVRADPLQAGLKARVSDSGGRLSPDLPLTEVGSEGTYTAEWDGKINGVIPRDGVMTIRVYGGSGSQFPATGTLILSSAKSLTLDPNPFEITGDNTATITAEMPTGLTLEVRIGSVRTVPLSEEAGLYTGAWDGRNDAGQLVSPGNYNLTLWNTATATRYDLQTNMTVSIVDTEAPDTLITNGPAEGSSIAQASVSFEWSGSDNIDAPLTFAYQLDEQPWSPFDAATSVTVESLSDGAHRFAVKARDQAGNEDASPAERNFTVDATPPEPAANFAATITDAGIRLDWSHSPSSDVAFYNLYWNAGSGEIDYDQPTAVIHHPTNAYVLTGLAVEGNYRFGLRAVDRAGNQELNTDVIDEVTVLALSLSVNVESDTYDRGQDVAVSGTVLSPTGEPEADVAVALAVRSDSTTRVFTSYTNAQGVFLYNFQPLAGEAGAYTVDAVVQRSGLEQRASDTFRILGLWLQPQSLMLDMSMNAGRTVDLQLRNIGDIALNALQYSVEDLNPADPLTATLDAAGLPDRLEPDEQVTVSVQLASIAGSAPGTPALLQVRAESAEGSIETSVVTVRLADAVALPVIEPQPYKIGVRPGESVTRTLTVTNAGYAPITSAQLALPQPDTYPWIQVMSGELGALGSQQGKEVQVLVSPPADMPLGTHVVQLDLNYDGQLQTAVMTVEIAATDLGIVAVTVHDDTGSLVSGAEVSLISTDFYVNTTPDGAEQEYNNVVQGTTDAAGVLQLTDVPPGDYRYLIQASGHDPMEGEIRVEPGTEPQALAVILVTNLVNVDFQVTQTTIEDQYEVTLEITYATNLTKPALFASPSSVRLSFFPEETQAGVITITNTSNNAPVRDMLMSSASLDPTDNELELVFANGEKLIQLPELGPKQSVQVPYTASIPSGATAKLNTRHLGNITVTGNYTFSINGQALEGTTTTPIPVIFSRPQDVSLPSIAFINDETDGVLNDLEYLGTSYRLGVASNRDVQFDFQPALRAVSHINGGPDAESILAENNAFWASAFNGPPPLAFKGDAVNFDIDGLEEAMEAQLLTNSDSFLAHPRSIGFIGKWLDRQVPDTYLIPVSITTIWDKGISVGECVSCGISWTAPPVPTLRIPEGEVRVQIKQKTALEREAFDVALVLTPTVNQLDDVSISLNVTDVDGADTGDLFYQIITQQSGITDLTGSTVTSPVNIGWQLVPGSQAGGDQAQGRSYQVSASISYRYQGNDYSYDTPKESITVLPMPKLTVDYEAPYVVMAGEPARIRVRVVNNGAGPANNLTIASAQPEIVDNPNGVPVNFAITGSSPSADTADFQPGEMSISFDSVPPGGTVEGYWDLVTSRHGYFVDFTATVKRLSYEGVMLDPLIEAINTKLVPAIGGTVSFLGCVVPTTVEVQLLREGEVVARDSLDTKGVYFIPDLSPGDYQWLVVDNKAQVLDSMTVSVLAEQPTSHLLNLVQVQPDSDRDGLDDCWELENFGRLDDTDGDPKDDADGDGVPNDQEYLEGTDPRNGDTDGDGVGDLTEIQQGTDPLDIANYDPNIPLSAVQQIGSAPSAENTVFFPYLGFLRDRAVRAKEIDSNKTFYHLEVFDQSSSSFRKLADLNKLQIDQLFNPSKDTYVLAHGWNGLLGGNSLTPDEYQSFNDGVHEFILTMARNLAGGLDREASCNSDVEANILAYNWTDLANSTDFSPAKLAKFAACKALIYTQPSILPWLLDPDCEQFRPYLDSDWWVPNLQVVPQAYNLKNELQNLFGAGGEGTKVQFLGHSLGAGIITNTAKLLLENDAFLPKISRLTLFDPPEEAKAFDEVQLVGGNVGLDKVIPLLFAHESRSVPVIENYFGATKDSLSFGVPYDRAANTALFGYQHTNAFGWPTVMDWFEKTIFSSPETPLACSVGQGTSEEELNRRATAREVWANVEPTYDYYLEAFSSLDQYRTGLVKKFVAFKEITDPVTGKILDLTEGVRGFVERVGDKVSETVDGLLAIPSEWLTTGPGFLINTTGGGLVNISASPSYAFSTIEIPLWADIMTAEYRPEVWDGDAVYFIAIDDLLIYSLSGSEFENTWTNTGYLDVSRWAGKEVTLTIGLASDKRGHRVTTSGFGFVDEVVVTDLDGDGDIDLNDVNIIVAAIGAPTIDTDDARDVDRDGEITSADAGALSEFCTREGCEIEGSQNPPPIIDLSIANYTLVGTRRVSRVEYEYDYQADVTSSGDAATNVTAIVTSNSPNTVIVEGVVAFGEVPAGSTITSTDTFTIRQNRRYPFDPTVLEWDIQATPTP